MQAVAAQVEVAVFEPDFLRIVGLTRHRHRQLVGRGLYGDFPGDDFDVAGCELGVHRPSLPLNHLAGDRHHRLEFQLVEDLERLAAGGADDLR
jgi:hypothetical protein